MNGVFHDDDEFEPVLRPLSETLRLRNCPNCRDVRMSEAPAMWSCLRCGFFITKVAIQDYDEGAGERGAET